MEAATLNIFQKNRDSWTAPAAKPVLCTLGTGPFASRVFRHRNPWLGEELWHEGIEVHGSAEGVRHLSRSVRHAGGGDLRKAGISHATYFNWKKKYARLMPSEMQRMRDLEDESRRLKSNVLP